MKDKLKPLSPRQHALADFKAKRQALGLEGELSSNDRAPFDLDYIPGARPSRSRMHTVLLATIVLWAIVAAVSYFAGWFTP